MFTYKKYHILKKISQNIKEIEEENYFLRIKRRTDKWMGLI